jgi:NAD(P)-dependent dehydrogenase (short-subunit alcohol dehydrogenase family)
MSGMSRIAVITGANWGLDYALAEGLAQQLALEDVVYLTGRNRDRGLAAVTRIARPRAHVRAEVLDVADRAGLRRATGRSSESTPTSPGPRGTAAQPSGDLLRREAPPQIVLHDHAQSQVRRELGRPRAACALRTPGRARVAR